MLVCKLNYTSKQSGNTQRIALVERLLTQHCHIIMKMGRHIPKEK